jgi:hypothetical protein
MPFWNISIPQASRIAIAMPDTFYTERLYPFMDLLIAQSFPFLWQEIFSEARQKDLWVEPLEIARMI